jgi:hypothetical protein
MPYMNTIPPDRRPTSIATCLPKACHACTSEWARCTQATWDHWSAAGSSTLQGRSPAGSKDGSAETFLHLDHVPCPGTCPHQCARPWWLQPPETQGGAHSSNRCCPPEVNTVHKLRREHQWRMTADACQQHAIAHTCSVHQAVSTLSAWLLQHHNCPRGQHFVSM